MEQGEYPFSSVDFYGDESYFLNVLSLTRRAAVQNGLSLEENELSNQRIIVLKKGSLPIGYIYVDFLESQNHIQYYQTELLRMRVFLCPIPGLGKEDCRLLKPLSDIIESKSLEFSDSEAAKIKEYSSQLEGLLRGSGGGGATH